MSKHILFFIDNIVKLIDKQKENMINELRTQIQKEENRKIEDRISWTETDCFSSLHSTMDNSCSFRLGDDEYIVAGNNKYINRDTKNSEINDYIQQTIIPLLNQCDILQLAIDRKLDSMDEEDTSFRLIEQLYKVLKDKYKENAFSNTIITSVSSHFHTRRQRLEDTHSWPEELQKEVKFFSRPVNNKSESDEYHWDSDMTATGKYNIGNVICDKYDKSDPHRLIAKMLFEDRASSNYFGMLLARFLQNKKIEELL